MKQISILLFIFLYFFLVSCFSQEKYTTAPKFLKRKLETVRYRKKYPLFEGNITLINDSVVQYDDKIIKLYNIHNDYKPIFYDGVFYPMIMIAVTNEVFKNEKEYTCIKIYNFREIKRKKQNYKTKQFVFQSWTQLDCNLIIVGSPPKYCIELKNENATKSTSITDFIAGAKLTLCWLYLIEI